MSCPIVRDTASVPCWLAEYEGELYFLTIQSDVTSPVTPPWLGHRVLVEGTVSAEPRICGGIVLKPVHLSVMPEPDASCNAMLPAEARYDLTFEPPRPPGPSKGRLAFDNPPPPAQPQPPPLPSTKEFVVPYDFDALVGFNHARVLTDVLEFGRVSCVWRFRTSPGRGIPPGGVAPPSDTPGILGRPPSFAAHRERRELRRDLAVALAEAGRALPCGRRAPEAMS